MLLTWKTQPKMVSTCSEKSCFYLSWLHICFKVRRYRQCKRDHETTWVFVPHA